MDGDGDDYGGGGDYGDDGGGDVVDDFIDEDEQEQQLQDQDEQEAPLADGEALADDANREAVTRFFHLPRFLSHKLFNTMIIIWCTSVFEMRIIVDRRKCRSRLPSMAPRCRRKRAGRLRRNNEQRHHFSQNTNAHAFSERVHYRYRYALVMARLSLARSEDALKFFLALLLDVSNCVR
jgi:hypothetical protein